MKSYLDWFQSPDVRPYVFVRKGNLPSSPGSFHQFDFPSAPVIKDPLFLKESSFASQILRLENRCFQAIGMTLPRWVFYDCSIMPGVVAGFAYKQKNLPPSIRKVVPIDESLEYVPISLFICIPTADRHWVAHNLCSVSSILPPEERFPYLGFLTKAFGLHYFNIQHLYGMTQWGSPAIKVHSNYGDFRIVAAYNEIHDYADTLTYLVNVESWRWKEFLEGMPGEGRKRKPSKYIIYSKDREAMKQLQFALESGEGPFWLDGKDFVSGATENQIQIYA